jgi:hypothetical protein
VANLERQPPSLDGPVQGGDVQVHLPQGLVLAHAIVVKNLYAEIKMAFS